jgi:predicted MFS family arabinose efflux permease
VSRELERAPTLLDAESGRRLIAGLLALVLVILTASALFVSQRALNAFDELLLPEFDRDAEIIAERLTSELARAAGLGIPLERLAGVEGFLDAYLNEHPALVYLGVGDAEGRLVASVGPAAGELDQLAPGTLTLAGEQRSITVTDSSARRTTMRVEAAERASRAGEAYALVHVGMDRLYAEQQIADIRWDIVVVLVVSLLVTFELLVFVIDRTMTTPLRLIDRAITSAIQGDWTSSGADRGARDEVGGLWGAMDETGRRIHDRLAGLDAKLARLQTVPGDLARRVEDLRGRLRWRLATAADRPVESRANARFTLFLFVFAEELSRSFLPLYAQSIHRPAAELGSLGQALEATGLAFLLSPEVVVGLPITVFMGVIAIATPFGASLTARYGSRTIFLVGAVPAVIGYLGTAAAVTVLDMVLWRSFSALGYALVTIACQGYLAELAGGDSRVRARNMAIFVGAVTTAVICGSAIGAVFADRLGYRATFVISAGFVALAAWLAARYLQDPASETRRERARTKLPRLTSQLRAFANRRFLALIVLAAIPAKLALTGFLFYAAPLYLSGLDVSQPTIGRMIMLYGLLMLVGTQLGARLHGGAWLGLLLISGGGLLTALALQLPWALAPELGMGLAIAVFGFAQGLAAAPMLAVLPDLCPEESQRFGATGLAALLRLAERIGSVLGPMLAAALVLRLGYASAIGVIGAISAVSAVGLLLAMLASTRGGMTGGSSASGGNG